MPRTQAQARLPADTGGATPSLWSDAAPQEGTSGASAGRCVAKALARTSRVVAHAALRGQGRQVEVTLIRQRQDWYGRVGASGPEMTGKPGILARGSWDLLRVGGAQVAGQVRVSSRRRRAAVHGWRRLGRCVRLLVGTLDGGTGSGLLLVVGQSVGLPRQIRNVLRQRRAPVALGDRFVGRSQRAGAVADGCRGTRWDEQPAAGGGYLRVPQRRAALRQIEGVGGIRNLRASLRARDGVERARALVEHHVARRPRVDDRRGHR